LSYSERRIPKKGEILRKRRGGGKWAGEKG